MTTITKYIACDGTEFDDEDECGMYESGIKIKNLRILMWDGKFNFLNSDDMTYNVGNMTYFRAESKEDLEAFIDIIEDDYGYCMDGIRSLESEVGLWDGVWKYNSFTSTWENCNNLYNYYKNIVETLA